MLKRQANVKTFLESELYNLNSEMMAKFMEQNQWNDDLKERFRIQVKTLQAHKADAQIEIEKVRVAHVALTGRLDAANTEFAKVFDVINSVVEL